MKTKDLLRWLWLMSLFSGGTARLGAETVAYWRFEGDGVTAPVDGASMAHSTSRTNGTPTGGIVAVDVSGNGNTLYAWRDGDSGMLYSNAVSAPVVEPAGGANDFCVVNGGSGPKCFTWGTQSLPGGINADTIQPLAWTLEATVYLDPSAADGWRTFLGRDGYQVSSTNANEGCLYFQKTSGGNLRILFVDAAGTSWSAEDPEPFSAGRWYHVAAVSDGSSLKLYKWDTTTATDYALVAETDISSSADARLVADTIDGSSLPLDHAGDPMNWTVGSAVFACGGTPEDGHVDRWYGRIDEVRISDEALPPGRLLFSTPLYVTDMASEPMGGGMRQFRMEWRSSEGNTYRIMHRDDMGQPWLPVAAGIPAAPPVNAWTSDPSAADHGFYRVETEVQPMVLDLDPSQVLNPVDEKIYGHFLEHIYHSANGGLWGELVWNRSLDMWPTAADAWSVSGGALVQSSLATDMTLRFGDPAWTDYELTLQARKDGGNEGFLIPFRADGDNYYWLNLGGWGNTQHAIEKGVAGAGRSVASPVAGGSISTGQWYDIRIRCEGSRFQVWLDGSQVFDWTDAGAHPAGAVGVGTWATQARFRNILVEDLAGAELYSGLPDLSLVDRSPDHWSLYGAATVDPSADAYNSDDSALITKTAAEEGGLLQGPMRFDVQSYTGSFWAKGSGITAMVARLRAEGGGVLAEQTLSAPDGIWRKYDFSLSPAVADLNGSLEIGFEGTGSVLLDQVSLMGQDAVDTGGYRPDLLAAADAIQPPVIRWPGGCFASVYRWKYGIGPQDGRRVHPVVQWGDQDVNAFGTDEFLRMCEAVGAEPLICINIGKGYACGAGEIENPYPSNAELLQDALDWIEYCNGPETSPWGAVRAANGHPEPYNVKYWEIDNEVWSAGSSWYVDQVNLYAPAMRIADPSIVLIACGSGGYDQSWNQTILDGCAAEIDYISVHNYFDPNGWATEPLNYENYLIDLAGRIASSANPGVKIYNSEWNAQSIDLRTGLFAGGLLNTYERQGANFRMGGPALMYRHLSAPDWNNAFVNFDHTGSFVAPNYVVMKLWRDHYQPQRIAVAGDAGSLNGVATRSDDGLTVVYKVINPAPTEVPLKLRLPAGTSVSSADFEYVTAPSLYTENSLADPNAVAVEAGAAWIDGAGVQVTLPARSAAAIRIALP